MATSLAFFFASLGRSFKNDGFSECCIDIEGDINVETTDLAYIFLLSNGIVQREYTGIWD